ncbi:SGNH hydrolase domain-containing protein [Kocuria flava]|uniref:SGNH hydrolase domain-containing protein n=1 Tax=Kocuria flava TaxID=446860 RepID=UPI0021506FA2|nr:SGNH hydrolase domain-containing protein [Kocuria flava]
MLIVVSLVLAVVATRFVENPLKQWAWPERSARRLAVVVVVCLGLVAVPVLGWAQADARRAAQIAAQADRNNPGAVALLPGFEYLGDTDAPTIPAADQVGEWPPAIGPECPGDWIRHYTVPSGCHVVREGAPDAPVVYAIGSSHVQHWIPTLERLADERDWTLITFPRPGCFFTAGHPNPDEQCPEWYESTRSFVEQRPPDILFTQATYDRNGENDEILMTGYEAETRYWTDRGITVVGIRDNPRWNRSQTQCALEAGIEAPECGRALADALGTPEGPGLALEDTIEGYGSMDMTQVICPDGYCPPPSATCGCTATRITSPMPTQGPP